MMRSVCLFQSPGLSSRFLVQFVTLVSDPCTLDIDGVSVGLTSTDVLFHLGAEEISRYILGPIAPSLFRVMPV